MSREVLQQALEALEVAKELAIKHKENELEYAFQQTQNKIKAALAQPEQESVEEYAEHMYQSRDGSWKLFEDEDHYQNTVENGTWPIRKIHASPPKRHPTKEPIMTKDEALQQAIERDTDKKLELFYKVIGKEPMAQPEQEPVAWIDDNGNLHRDEPPYAYGPDPRPLYLAPPKREWVGLDWGKTEDKWINSIGFLTGARWAEDRLKEKNT